MKKAIIIDDDEDWCATMRLVLQGTKIDVMCLHSPFGALNAIRKGDFHLVILDVAMPGLDGPRLVGLMRETKGLENTRVLLCSGLEEPQLRAIARKVGGCSYVTKSAPDPELIAVVLNALRG